MQIGGRWIPTAAIVCLLVLGCPLGLAQEGAAEVFCENMFQFSLSESGPPFRAKAAYVGMPTVDDRVCRPEPLPEWILMDQVIVSAQCYSTAHPELGRDWLDALHKQAVQSLNNWLATDEGQQGLPREIRSRAGTKYRQLLRETRLCRRLQEAWIEHAQKNTTCYQETMVLLEKESQAGAAQVKCDEWRRILNICTSNQKTVESHIKFFPQKFAAPRQKAAVERLQGAGLGECLATVIRRSKDEKLIAAVETVGFDTQLSERQRIEDQVWALWKAAGVEEWLDATAAAGTVPETVIKKIQACQEELPQRSSGGSGGGKNAGSDR